MSPFCLPSFQTLAKNVARRAYIFPAKRLLDKASKFEEMKAEHVFWRGMMSIQLLLALFLTSETGVARLLKTF
jgi:hypothetical protein